MGEKSSIFFSKFNLAKRSKANILLLFGAVLVVFTLLIIFSTQWKTSQKVEKIEITGTKYLSHKEIITKIKPVIKQKKAEDILLLKKIELLAETHDFVRKANASIKKNTILEVNISERIPVGYFRKKGGSIWYLDSCGEIIPFRFLSDYTDLLIVSSLSKKTKNDSMVASNAAIILTELQKSKYDDFNYILSELIYKDSDSSFYFVCADNLHKFQLGRAENVVHKLNNLKAFAASKVAKDLKITKYSVDLRWENRIIIRQIPT